MERKPGDFHEKDSCTIRDEAVESLRTWFHTYLAKYLSRVLNQYHLWLEMRILSSLNKPFIQTTNALSAEHLTHLAWQKALHRCFPAISFLHCGYCSLSNLRIIRTQINRSINPSLSNFQFIPSLSRGSFFFPFIVRQNFCLSLFPFQKFHSTVS